MLDFFKKKQQGDSVIFKIDGMHCTSCSMNIDGELEDTEGVYSAETSYAKAKTVVAYDQTTITKEKIKSVIEKLGYLAKDYDSV